MSQQLFKTTKWQPFRPAADAATAVETTLTADCVLSATIPAHTRVVEGVRGGRMRFFSNCANDETCIITFYAVEERNGKNGGYYVTNLGTTGTITFGTEVGTPLSDIDGTFRFAEAMTWTPSTFGTALLVYCGGNVADVDPAANAISELLWSDFGNIEMLTWRVTTYGLTATSKLNIDWKLDV